MKKLVLAVLSIVLWSCNNEDNSSNVETTKAVVQLNYSYAFNNQPFKMLKEYSTGINDEKITITNLKILLTKFTLINNNGIEVGFQDKIDYHLLNAGKPAVDNNKIITNIPVGTYNYVQFNFGLDYEEDLTDGDNDGAALVDVINFSIQDKDMNWDWSLGYKFINLEGVYKTKDTELNNFLFHIGTHQSSSSVHHSKANILTHEDEGHVSHPDHVEGYALAHRILKYKLDTPIIIENDDSSATIDFTILVDKLLNGKTQYSLAELGKKENVSVTTGSITPKMANNVAHAIVLKK